MATQKISEKRRKKIIADWALEGSYRAAARKNGVSPNTVRRLVLADPQAAGTVQDKKRACARDMLSYMDGQRDAVCTIIGQGLEELSDPVRLKTAPIRDIATTMGILIDKWTRAQQAAQGKEPVTVELAKELEDYSE